MFQNYCVGQVGL